MNTVFPFGLVVSVGDAVIKLFCWYVAKYQRVELQLKIITNDMIINYTTLFYSRLIYLQ